MFFTFDYEPVNNCNFLFYFMLLVHLVNLKMKKSVPAASIRM